MSLTAQLFIYYVTDLIYKFGFNTTKMSKLSPGTILRIDDDEAEKLRCWLINNGYLYEHNTIRHPKHGWMSHREPYGITWTGVTPKGWAIAHKYIGFSCKEEAELQLRNCYAVDHAGTDMFQDMEEYRKEYIDARRPGWFFLG